MIKRLDTTCTTHRINFNHLPLLYGQLPCWNDRIHSDCQIHHSMMLCIISLFINSLMTANIFSSWAIMSTWSVLREVIDYTMCCIPWKDANYVALYNMTLLQMAYLPYTVQNLEPKVNGASRLSCFFKFTLQQGQGRKKELRDPTTSRK